MHLSATVSIRPSPPPHHVQLRKPYPLHGSWPTVTPQDCVHPLLTDCSITCRSKVGLDPSLCWAAPLSTSIENNCQRPAWRQVPRPLRRPSAGTNPRGCPFTWWWALPSPVPPPTCTPTAATPRCAAAQATTLASCPQAVAAPCSRRLQL